MVLVRMRLGLFERDLAHRFNIHVSTVNTICISWVNFMYLKFGCLNIWPDREAIDKAMPQSFKDKYPKTRVIIDGTESSAKLHLHCFCTVKHSPPTKATQPSKVSLEFLLVATLHLFHNCMLAAFQTEKSQ